VQAIEADYPAAHSMDTVWFATDRDGHVGVFKTGENGIVPNSASNEEGPDSLLNWHVRPGSPLPLRVHDSNYWPPNYWPAELGRLGVFFFYYEAFRAWLEASRPPRSRDDFPFYRPFGLGPRSFVGPYIRALVPDDLLNVDQLPPDLRARCKRTCFADWSFVENEFLQPGEHFGCRGWWHVDGAAYLSADGRTLRPIPERMDEFAEFRREFLAADPRRAEWFVFDGPGRATREPPA
jgi:hypothetical protein